MPSPHPRLRALLVASAILVVAGTGIVLAVGGSDPPLPAPQAAQAVREELGAPDVGTGVAATFRLDQSVTPAGALGEFALPPDTVRGRYWAVDATRWRAELQGTGHDVQLVRDGGNLSLYWSGNRTRIALAAASLPDAVGAIGPVRVEPTARPEVIGGRQANTVAYRPGQPGSLVRRIELAADRETGMPLAIRVWAVDRDDPVFDLEVTALRRERVPLSRVRLQRSAIAATLPLELLFSLGQRNGNVRVVGAGWRRAVRLPVESAPGGLVELLGGRSPDDGAPDIPLRTPLLSTFVDGDALLIGPVTPEVLDGLADR